MYNEVLWTLLNDDSTSFNINIVIFQPQPQTEGTLFPSQSCCWHEKLGK